MTAEAPTITAQKLRLDWSATLDSIELFGTDYEVTRREHPVMYALTPETYERYTSLLEQDDTPVRPDTHYLADESEGTQRFDWTEVRGESRIILDTQVAWRELRHVQSFVGRAGMHIICERWSRRSVVFAPVEWVKRARAAEGEAATNGG